MEIDEESPGKTPFFMFKVVSYGLFFFPLRTSLPGTAVPPVPEEELLQIEWPSGGDPEERALDSDAEFFLSQLRRILRKKSELADIRRSFRLITHDYYTMGYPEQPWMAVLRAAWSFAVQRHHVMSARYRKQAEIS